jgi:hypothetical protein
MKSCSIQCRWCLVCCKCKGDCWTSVFNETINCERYVRVIPWLFFSELTEEERLYGWFQQDSATAQHCTYIYAGFVRCLRGQNLSAVIFSQHVHPILILVIFFFWSCLMEKVSNCNSQTEELKENIRRNITVILAEQLQRVRINQNLFRRCEECLRVE